MHTILNGPRVYESGQENKRQPQQPESKEVKQGKTNTLEIDLMKDIISDLECSLNNEY